MKKVGFAGFGKSFLAWNLAGAVEGSVIYADHRAPYRVWNKTETVCERWDDVLKLSPPLVCVDHEEAEVAPDVVVFGVTPDLVHVDKVLMKAHGAGKPILPVLIGYETCGTPWPFPDTFRPVLTLPWDMRQATSPLTGMPLTRRDNKWRGEFLHLWEVIQGVAAV